MLQGLYKAAHVLQDPSCSSSHEAQGFGYILLYLMDSDGYLYTHQTLTYLVDQRRDIFESPEVQFALQVRSARMTQNYIKFFNLLRSAPYVEACAMFQYVAEMREVALRRMYRSLRMLEQDVPVSEIMSLLCFNSEEETIDYCTARGLVCQVENGSHGHADYAVAHFSRTQEFSVPDISSEERLKQSQPLSVIQDKRMSYSRKQICHDNLPKVAEEELRAKQAAREKQLRDAEDRRRAAETQRRLEEMQRREEGIRQQKEAEKQRRKDQEARERLEKELAEKLRREKEIEQKRLEDESRRKKQLEEAEERQRQYELEQHRQAEERRRKLEEEKRAAEEALREQERRRKELNRLRRIGRIATWQKWKVVLRSRSLQVRFTQESLYLSICLSVCLYVWSFLSSKVNYTIGLMGRQMTSPSSDLFVTLLLPPTAYSYMLTELCLGESEECTHSTYP